MHFRHSFPVVLVSLLLNVATVSVASEGAEEARLHSAVRPECRRGGHLKRFHETNELLARGNVDLLFIGDSITAGWSSRGAETWEKYYARRNAVNLGRSGERTQHVLWQLENLNVDRIEPKLAVVLIGTNNVTRNTPDETIEGITLVVERLRHKLPKTTILLLGIFPRGADNDDPGRQAVEEINLAIARLGDGKKKIIYKDLRNLFVDADGKPTPRLRSDHVHITPDGYRAWAEAIEPIVVGAGLGIRGEGLGARD